MKRAAVYIVIMHIACNVLLAGEDRIVDSITPEHPRIIMTHKRAEEIKHLLKADTNLQVIVQNLKAVGDCICKSEPVTRNLVGDKRKRLLSTSRLVLSRIMTLGMLYRIDGDEKWKIRALKEMKAVCDFSDWHPDHFLDTAEMSAAVAIGYDWFYNDLSAEERAWIRKGLIELGVEPGLKGGWWANGHNNWNQVCNCGLTLAAIALAEEIPEKAEKLLQTAKEGHATGLAVYDPAGVYPEGPSYWDYGTSFSVLMSSALLSATGNDWGITERPGFAESFTYRTYVEGPLGLVVNYSDGGEGSRSSPCHFYMSRRTGLPGLSSFALQSLENDFKTITNPKFSENMDRRINRFLPLAVAWYVPEKTSQEPALDWFATGKSRVHLAIMRSAWNDPDALFASLKAGNLTESHGHLDTGSFVIDASGERWASDLGSEKEIYDRSDTWSLKQESFRWKFFRANNFSHNTLTIDGQIQRVDGTAPIIKTSSGDSPFAIADLSSAYAGQAETVMRGIMLVKRRKAVLIRDEITGLAEGKMVTWNMTTLAGITLDADKRVARMTLGGKEAVLELQSEGGEFSVCDAKPEMDIETQNPDCRRLQVQLKFSGKPLTIQVVFFPGKRFAVQALPLADW